MSSNRYSLELRERAVRLVLEHRSEYSTELDAVRAIAPKLLHMLVKSWQREQRVQKLSKKTGAVQYKTP